MSSIQSVHLQNFPDMSRFGYDGDLVTDMDYVREVCSVALFLRDRKNLRVRLPLNYMKIIGSGADRLKQYQDIIIDEVNVKEIIFENDISHVADFVLEVNLKALGVKYGDKLRDIMKCVKDGNWQVVEGEKVSIAGFTLYKDEYVIKLSPKDKNAQNMQALSDNKLLIELDFNITHELEIEGVARDFVRIIQQNRKDADLNLSDRIKLSIKTDMPDLIEAIKQHSSYIQAQTLSTELNLVNTVSETFVFDDDFNNKKICVGFSVNK